MPDPFTILPARYAKGKMKIVCQSIRNDGFKERQHRLADSLSNGRYSGRENAYILSPGRAKKFQELWAAGWDASAVTGTLQPPEGD